MRRYQQEVEAAMRRLACASYRASCEKFCVPRCVGVPVPKLRARCKKGFSFSGQPEATQWKIWDFIWRHSRQHEAQTAALLFAQQFQKPVILKWINHVDNWAHSDALSKIYSFILERHPSLVYPILKKWNTSTDPWKRRASIVSLIYYASPRRSAPPPTKILPLVRRLLRDPDPYVQKAVGWTLRECGTLYPVQTWNFIVHHARSLATVSFSYATERLTKKEKTKLKKLRHLSS